MTHHDHTDCHCHTHHDHDHESKTTLSFDEKMVKLIDHWLKHNTDHADNYKKWAEQAKENNLSEVGKILEEIADMTIAINEKFDKALKLVK